MFGNKINLRALSKDDAKISWKWRNTEAMREYYSGHPFYITQEDEEAWLAKISGSNYPLTSFGVEEKSTKKLVGMSFLKNINMLNRTSEFAIFIGDETAKGKGYAKEATLKTMEFAFKDLNLNRIFLVVQEDNKKAVDLYKKCGYCFEGILRESVYKIGKYKNELIMSILKQEYIKLYDSKFAEMKKTELLIN